MSTYELRAGRSGADGLLELAAAEDSRPPLFMKLPWLVVSRCAIWQELYADVAEPGVAPRLMALERKRAAA